MEIYIYLTPVLRERSLINNLNFYLKTQKKEQTKSKESRRKKVIKNIGETIRKQKNKKINKMKKLVF